MVGGLERFRDCFRDHTDKYVLIGGSACDILFDEAGLSFRATKDLDIVLCVETLDAAFVKKFWSFVREAGYQTQQTMEGNRRHYRFQRPANPEQHSERIPCSSAAGSITF